MKCPHCKGKMRQTTRYAVKGEKHKIPGVVTIRKCQCGKVERFFTSKETDYFEREERLRSILKEERERNLTTRIKVDELQKKLHSGQVKKQIVHLEKHLTTLKKTLP